MIRVLVADSSRIHTRLLADALTRNGELEVIPFESHASGLISAVLTRRIDVLVISSKLYEQSGKATEALREVRAACPQARAILLLVSSEDESVLEAFRAGARGVFDKNDSLELLSKCVRCVYAGEIWVNHHYLEVIFEALAKSPIVRATNADGMNLLSDRELQVVCCLAEGLTNRQIAQRLKLSQHTVKNYLFRVFDKLGVSSRVELLSRTLSQSSDQISSDGSRTVGYSLDESNLIEKSAQAGMPAAQLALAQLHLARRAGPQDLVDAYMWYLIAIERANRAREFITKGMTPPQLEEAKKKAEGWAPLRKQAAKLSDGPSSRTRRISDRSE